ncbi:hypothetical protein J4417_04065 [Candidatus Woesearchaeota archaeon]|nr:hypothetical protein [Candidatus Woesearchaeota archaeon]
MASSYGNTKLALNGLIFQHSEDLLCGYLKIFNGVVLDKGNPTSPRNIRLSYSEGTPSKGVHSFRTLVGFNFYPSEKRFESDLEWIIRTKDVNSQTIRFETEKLDLQTMMPEERKFLTRLLIQLEDIAPTLLNNPRPLASRMPGELRKITEGYPENFRHQFQEKAPLGRAYSLQKFSVPMPPESWGQSTPRSERIPWWDQAAKVSAEICDVRASRYR